ncbi:MAG: hypothetical protein ACLP2P_14070 [Desulfobaccales bacterium]
MMKKLNLMAGILGVMAFLMAPPSWAQQQVPPAAPEQQAPPAIPAAPQASKLYNPQAVETLTGQVTAVNRQASKRAGKPDRVTMVLQTNQGPVKVHLGPADYLDQQALKLAVGDQVQVKGVKLSRLKAPTLIAGEVRKGDQVLKLRDDATGRPLWFKGRKPKGAS